MINLSDDSENEEEEFTPQPKSAKGTSPGPWSAATLPSGTVPRRQTVSAIIDILLYALTTPTDHTQIAEPTAHLPVTQSRSYNLYVVAEDCAPPKDNEGIMYVHKGQIYDVIDNKSDWWWARLVRDLTSDGDSVCQQGWVPGSFLEKYSGSLTADEQTNINASEFNSDSSHMTVM